MKSDLRFIFLDFRNAILAFERFYFYFPFPSLPRNYCIRFSLADMEIVLTDVTN